MFTKRSTKMLMVALVGLILGSLIALVPTVFGQGLSGGQGRIIRVEVAEIGTRFSVDETPVHDDGLPAYGAEFVTEGYLYPAGTLTCVDNACNGVLPDGSPEFPALVLGKWVCRGWLIGEGFHTTTGPMVVSTQIYDFGNTPGAKTVVTDGYELVDFNVPVQRAIIGGTGQYRKAHGQQTQELLGFGFGAGVALSVEIDLR